MALSRDDFAAAYHVLASGARTPQDVKSVIRDQLARLDRGERATLTEMLGVPPGAQVDLRSHPAQLDALGEMLIELEILNEPELERLVASFLSRTYRRTLPPVALPAHLSRYDFQWEIGRGRTGVVYRGRREQAPHEIAIKLLRPEARPDPARAKAMLERAEPGLVRAFDAGDDFLVTEFVEGSSVDALLAERKLSLRHGFEVVAKAARVLAPLHAKGLAHGSLAPGCVLIDRQENAHVAEFGLAPGSPADDVFALGAILYEIAAGVPPYEGFHAQELRPPSRYNPSADGAPERVIAKACARDESRRYPDAGALADDLERWLRHEEVLADVDAATSGRAPSKKDRVPLVVAGIAVFLLVILAIIFGWPGENGKPDDPSKTVEPAPHVPRTSDTATTTPDPPKTVKPPKPKTDPKEEEIKRKGPIGRNEERELFAAGSMALSKGDYEKLVALGEEFLLRDADRDYAYYWLAVGYRARKDHEQALVAIDNAISKAPEKSEYLAVRLPLLLARGEAKRALKDLEAMYGKNVREVNSVILALRDDAERDSFARLQRGALYHHKRNYKEAADDFHAVVQSGDSKTLYFLGLSLLGAERTDDAIDALRRFIAAHAGLPAADEARALLAELEKK